MSSPCVTSLRPSLCPRDKGPWPAAASRWHHVTSERRKHSHTRLLLRTRSSPSNEQRGADLPATARASASRYKKVPRRLPTATRLCRQRSPTPGTPGPLSSGPSSRYRLARVPHTHSRGRSYFRHASCKCFSWSVAYLVLSFHSIFKSTSFTF